MSTKKRGRNEITIEKKKEILDHVRQSGDVEATANKFGLTKRCINRMMKKEKEIRDAFDSSPTARSMKRLRNSNGAGCSTVDVTKLKKKPASKDRETLTDSQTAKGPAEVREDNLGYSQQIKPSTIINQTSANLDSMSVDSEHCEHPSASTSNQYSEAEVSVRDNQAAQTLLDLNPPVSTTDDSVVPGKPQDKSTNRWQGVQTVLPTTLDSHNSAPDEETQTQRDNPPCYSCNLQKLVKSSEKFCVQCSKYFCPEHVKLHSSLHGEEHSLIEAHREPLRATVDYPQTQSKQLMTSCPQHHYNKISSGCVNCEELFCLECVCWLASKEEDKESLFICGKDRRHEPFALGKLEQRLKRKAVGNLENKLQEGLQLLSAAKTKLGEAISTLHTQRDKERKEVDEKFRKLEEETRGSFSRDGKLADLDKLVTSLETKMRSITDIDPNGTCNPGSVIAEYRQAISDGQNWIIPSIRLPQYEWRDIKSEEGLDSGVTGLDWIDIKPPLTLGTRLTDIKLDINESVYSSSLCHYRDMTYIFYHQSDRVVSVDESGTVSNIITLDKDSGYRIRDIAVNNEKIFVLNKSTHIRVYSLTGELITSWELPESCYRITVSGDLLVISTYGGDLLIYTEEGEKIRQLHTRLDKLVDFYPVDSKSVIVRYYNDDDKSFTVYRVDIRTGGFMWRREDIRSRSAVSDGHGNLLIWNWNDDLCILDISTGKTLRTVSRQDIHSRLGYELGFLPDVELDISDDTLIILHRGYYRQISNSSSDCDGESEDLSASKKETHLFKLQLDYSDRPPVN